MLFLIALAVLGFRRTPTGFIPKQDMGYLITMVQLPDGASVERSSAVVNKAVEVIRSHPGVGHAISYSGYSGTTRSNSPNYGSIFIMPKPFQGRVLSTARQQTNCKRICKQNFRKSLMR